MELTLKVVSGKHAGQKLRIPTPKFLIGRGEDCHLRPNSDLVSRHHCILFVGDSGAAVRDLNSRNGTFVNDERISGDRPLRAGDRLKIGQLTFEVRLNAGETAEVPQTASAKGPANRSEAQSPVAPATAKPSEPAPAAAQRSAAAKAKVDMGTAGQGEDDDVIEWFKEDRTGAATRDTVRLDASETTTIVTDNLKQTIEQSGEASVLDDEKSKKKSGPSPSEVHRQQTKDTREAATQILKQLFKGR